MPNESMPDRATARILIVEDVADDVALMISELRRSGLAFSYEHVETETDFRDALRSFVPDIVLSDHSLPHYDARDVLRVAADEAPHTPVIIVTGSLDEETAAEYMRSGAADYILKHRLQRLGPAVRRALDLRRALDDLLRSEEMRARSEQRFRKLVEHSSDVITLLDGAGRILYSTQAQKPTLGYDQGELIGHNVFDLVHPEDAERALTLFRSVLVPGTAVARDALRVRHKNGTWRDLEIAGVNHLNDPIVEAIVVTYHDVTERKRAEAALREFEERHRQAQKMDALGTLAGGIAHDFNNILTAIGGNAELARADAPPDSRLRQDLDEILAGHARAKDLVKRILLFSRRQETERKVIALPPVVDEALRLLRASLPAKIKIQQTVAPDVPPVSADATQIHQVVMNLGTNAGYAMNETGGTLSVAVDVVIADVDTAPAPERAPGPYVRVTVRDTGTGMSPEIRQRLFEPFFTTKGRAGTGLGLSVVHGIVQDHGGAITVESELGKGTEFRIYLPAAAAGEERAAAAEPPIIRGTGQHVMLVDDDEAIARVMSRTVERLGYRCTAFTNAKAALQSFRTTPQSFDAVVTDLQMADISGLELARELRKVRPDMPVAVASGYTGADAGAAAGSVTAWIHKPASLAELSHALQFMLSGASNPATPTTARKRRKPH